MSDKESLYRILSLEKEKYADALEFVCREFSIGSVLHRACGVDFHVYTDYMRTQFYEKADEGLSFLATETSSDDIVGCLLANDFSKSYGSEINVEQMMPIKALIEQLEKKYTENRQIHPGSTLLVDIAVVSGGARGQGVYAQLRSTVHTAAFAKGYDRVVGELSSAPAQHVCVTKFGHRVFCEIEYESFVYKERHPFSSIKEPTSIQLVEGKLTGAV